MTSSTAPRGARRRGTASTVLLVGFLTVTPMVFAGVPLPITGAVPLGVLGWGLVGALAELWGGTLVASLISVAAAMGVATIGFAALSRAFTNTPWYLSADRFANALEITILLAMALVAAGFSAASFVRRRSPFVGVTKGGAAAVLVVLVLAIGGGTLFAERIQAVIPFGARQLTVIVEHDRIELRRETSAAGPTYWTFENTDLRDKEVGILRIASDEELALRLTGEMGGTYESNSRVFGWIALPAPGTSIIRRGDLEPGRYLLLVVEPLAPQVEGEPDQGGESADRVLVGPYIEIEVTD